MSIELVNDYTYFVDVNECEEYNGGCSDKCVNTNGSYHCSCPRGYNLTNDDHICQGISLHIHVHALFVTKQKCSTKWLKLA